MFKTYFFASLCAPLDPFPYAKKLGKYEDIALLKSSNKTPFQNTILL